MKVYLDIETTGLHPTKHGIISIGYLIEINGEAVASNLITMNSFEYAPNYTQEALDINGYTLEEIEGFQPPKEAVKQFITELNNHTKGRYTIVGYNSDNFDNPRVKKLMERYYPSIFNKLFNYKTIDVYKTVLWMDDAGAIKLPSHSLPVVAEHYSLPHDKHNALSDCIATREINRKLKELVCTK
jgi:DNA polymerase III epsilon subunit-like protein